MAWALLASERGPLAIIGHSDLAWLLSFTESHSSEATGPPLVVRAELTPPGSNAELPGHMLRVRRFFSGRVPRPGGSQATREEEAESGRGPGVWAALSGRTVSTLSTMRGENMAAGDSIMCCTRTKAAIASSS